MAPSNEKRPAPPDHGSLGQRATKRTRSSKSTSKPKQIKLSLKAPKPFVPPGEPEKSTRRNVARPPVPKPVPLTIDDLCILNDKFRPCGEAFVAALNQVSQVIDADTRAEIQRLLCDGAYEVWDSPAGYPMRHKYARKWTSNPETCTKASAWIIACLYGEQHYKIKHWLQYAAERYGSPVPVIDIPENISKVTSRNKDTPGVARTRRTVPPMLRSPLKSTAPSASNLGGPSDTPEDQDEDDEQDRSISESESPPRSELGDPPTMDIRPQIVMPDDPFPGRPDMTWNQIADRVPVMRSTIAQFLLSAKLHPWNYVYAHIRDETQWLEDHASHLQGVALDLQSKGVQVASPENRRPVNPRANVEAGESGATISTIPASQRSRGLVELLHQGVPQEGSTASTVEAPKVQQFTVPADQPAAEAVPEPQGKTGTVLEGDQGPKEQTDVEPLLGAVKPPSSTLPPDDSTLRTSEDFVDPVNPSAGGISTKGNEASTSLFRFPPASNTSLFNPPLGQPTSTIFQQGTSPDYNTKSIFGCTSAPTNPVPAGPQATKPVVEEGHDSWALKETNSYTPRSSTSPIITARVEKPFGSSFQTGSLNFGSRSPVKPTFGTGGEQHGISSFARGSFSSGYQFNSDKPAGSVFGMNSYGRTSYPSFGQPSAMGKKTSGDQSVARTSFAAKSRSSVAPTSMYTAEKSVKAPITGEHSKSDVSLPESETKTDAINAHSNNPHPGTTTTAIHPTGGNTTSSTVAGSSAPPKSTSSVARAQVALANAESRLLSDSNILAVKDEVRKFSRLVQRTLTRMNEIEAARVANHCEWVQLHVDFRAMMQVMSGYESEEEENS